MPPRTEEAQPPLHTNYPDSSPIRSRAEAVAILRTQHRMQTLHAGDEFGFSALLSGKSKVLQTRALDRVDVLVFDGEQLLEAFNTDPAFGMAFAMRLVGVVSERLSAAREQLLDMYAPEAKRAGT